MFENVHAVFESGDSSSQWFFFVFCPESVILNSWNYTYFCSWIFFELNMNACFKLSYWFYDANLIHGMTKGEDIFSELK